ncbi:NADP-dependent oxidoreductase [Streptomyces rubrogriseus]|uniref:NADP-dependent oxidoreductase n=1 Tax=Streptomyces rubrogriseus TaxID=194673 RepID=A0A6G3TRZ9_9ACTN|nr:NADP-dependent oxidoreductase [Streptomyces rubrogriseus]
MAGAYGGPEVLSVIDVAVPEPRPNEVRITVRAAGVNPFDYKSYSGAFGVDPERLPVRLGVEAAGVVTAVGADAIGPAGPIAVGDEVITYTAPGAYAAEIVVPASSVVPKPVALSWEQAGGLLAAGVTAVHALEAVGLGKGETVLIHGAAGGVGLVAVQLAVARGATVVATASRAKHEVREAARLQLTEAATAGRLRIVIADSHPLREAATAHREIMAGHTTGKIVLVL